MLEIVETRGWIENQFFNKFSSFTPYWIYKPTNTVHAVFPGVHTSEKFINSSTIEKPILKCDVFDGSVVNGLGQPILYSFILDKPLENTVFCEHEARNNTL